MHIFTRHVHSIRKSIVSVSLLALLLLMRTMGTHAQRTHTHMWLYHNFHKLNRMLADYKATQNFDNITSLFRPGLFFSTRFLATWRLHFFPLFQHIPMNQWYDKAEWKEREIKMSYTHRTNTHRNAAFKSTDIIYICNLSQFCNR